MLANTALRGGKAVFSEDGRLLLFLVKGCGSTVWIWDVASRRIIRTLRPQELEPRHSPGAVHYSEKADFVVASDHYGGTSVWRASTGKLLRSWKPLGPIRVLENMDRALYSHSNQTELLSPDGTKRLTWDDDGSWTLWDTKTGGSLGKLGFAIGAALAISFPTSTDTFLAANSDGHFLTMNCWSLASGRLVRGVTIPVLEWTIARAIAFSPDGHLAVLGAVSNEAELKTGEQPNQYPLQIFDVAAGVCMRTLSGQSGPTTAVAFSPDSKIILAASEDGSATFWEAENGKVRWTLSSDGQRVRCVAFSPKGDHFLLGTRLYDIKTGSLIRYFPDKDEYGGTNSVSMSADQRHIVTGNSGWDDEDKGNAVIWDSATGTRLHKLHGHPLYVSSVAFSPDGKRVVTGGGDGTARIWNVESGRQLYTLCLHSARAVTSVAFSADGARVLSGNEDGSIGVWEVESGTLLATMLAAPDGEWVVFTPEGFLDASAKGCELIHLAFQMNTVLVEKFFRQLHRPDLVREKLSGDLQGRVRAAGSALDFSSLLTGDSAPQMRLGGKATPERSAMSDRESGELLEYQVVRRLGSGTFGEVFLCRHPEWNINVAVKVPREEILADPGMLSYLQKEAEEWTGLGLHPFIAYCYCLHPIDNLPLFVVEYAAGGTLRDRIERSPEAVHDLHGNLDLAIQLCHALEHAHGCGLIHRDIKPENILIGACLLPRGRLSVW